MVYTQRDDPSPFDVPIPSSHCHSENRGKSEAAVNILVILAHPGAKSFNRAIAETVIDTLRGLGHEVVFHDLYRESFDPVLPMAEVPKNAALPEEIRDHCQELAVAEGIVIIHPNWWGQPPAILKGWVDRVFRPGVAYEFVEAEGEEGVPKGLLKARAALVLNTSNTPWKRETEVFGDPLERVWKDCIFDLCGVRSFARRMFGVVVTSTPEERERWLEEVRGIVATTFPK
jgi:NAD(P)H dehydrogenase (quinone)